LGSPTQFTDASNTGVRPINSVIWNFGDNNTSTSSNPTYTYAAAGTYSASYSLITDLGCRSDTVTKIVTVNSLPSGTISGTAVTCINGPEPTITFTGSQGTAPYVFNYAINVRPNLRIAKKVAVTFVNRYPKTHTWLV
jgi:PKD repeat protein